MPLAQGSPETRHSTSDVASPVLSRGEGSPPSSYWQHFSWCLILVLQDAVGLLGFQSALLAYIQLVDHQDLQVFFCKLPSGCSVPSLYQHLLLFLPRCRILHIPLLNFMRFLISCISHYFQFCAFCERAEGSLCPTVQFINEEVKQYRTQY